MSLLTTLQQIKNEGFSPRVLSKYSKDELYVVQKILAELQEKGSSPTLDSLWSDDFETRPVSIDEFVTNDYYFGRVGKSIYPVWRKDLSEVLSPLSNVVEWIIRGGIGSGKTSVAVVANIYRIYYLLCLRNPQTFYGLADGSPIVFGLFNVFRYLAVATSYTYLTTWLRDMSPFFSEIRGDHRLKRLTDKQVLSLPKNISIALGAVAIHALGQNIYGGLCDETEFGRSKSITSEDKSQIADLYHNVRTRMDSRFMQKGGSNPGLLCLVSSSRDSTQFLSQHTRQRKGDPHTFVSQYALYEVKDNVYKDSPRFKVAVGDKLRRSFILDGKIDVPEGLKVIEVPVEFKPAFEHDIDTAIRDIAGVETYGSTLFFPQRERLLEIVDKSIPRKHPFSQDEVVLSTKEDIFIEDYFIHSEMVDLYDKTNSLYRPKFFPYADRYIHVDLAKTRDCAGIAMSTVSEMVLIDRVNAAGMRVKARDYRHFVDFMLRIRAAHGAEIDFAKIRQFVFFLIDTCHFKVRWISYDSYQSTDSIQIFNKERLQAKEVSVDKKPGPYRTFRSVLLERRLDTYHYEPFYDEITQLEDHTAEGGKVDHPPTGSKDCADALCGSIAGSLLAKGEQITGTDAERMLNRAHSYTDTVSTREELVDPVDWTKNSSRSKNPLEKLFEEK